MNTPAHRKTVLWIDDDEAGIGLGARLLESEGVSVDIAATGGRGLVLAAANPYSLILLDLHLPDASGLDILRSMVASGVRTPVVMVTGYASLPIAVEAVKYGAVDIRSKPFFSNEVLGLLELYEARSAQGEVAAEKRRGAKEPLMRSLGKIAIMHPRSSLAQTARKVGLSRHAVEYLVRAETGSCWRDWRRRVLMQHAAAIITTTDAPFKALAAEFGYSAIQSFSRAFREVWGVSPGVFRRRGGPATEQ